MSAITADLVRGDQDALGLHKDVMSPSSFPVARTRRFAIVNSFGKWHGLVSCLRD
jgi:hypothetical protein